MQIKNNYDLGVFNGETGVVTRVDREDQKLFVQFDQGELAYEAQELDQLVLAYCSSVHKSQGSEFPVVVMPVHTAHFIMLQRNLLYTGLTRGRKLVVLIGTPKAMAMAIKNDRAPKRHAHLKGLLDGSIVRARAMPV